jgi:exodeoxyribonuclease III
MIISTYNVNGIRAAVKKGFADWVQNTSPDVICLQELKADETQIPDEIKALGYYEVYHPAIKKGYSGVGILSKVEPELIKIGTGIEWIDAEGRVVMARINGIDVYSVYAPSGTTGDERQQVKYDFLDAFKQFSLPFLKQENPVVLCGDYNIAHTEIDIHDPVSNKKTSGFLPEEREWFTKYLKSGYKDVFRELNPGLKDVYSWWTYRAGAKANNKGWRIDYHLASPGMNQKAVHAKMERDLNMSDHVPVTVKYDI